MQQSRFTRCAYPLNRGLAAHALMLAGDGGGELRRGAQVGQCFVRESPTGEQGSEVVVRAQV